MEGMAKGAIEDTDMVIRTVVAMAAITAHIAATTVAMHHGITRAMATAVEPHRSPTAPDVGLR
jgi:hypothetical protein